LTEEEEADKGPLVYQESKVFQGQSFLCNVFDTTKGRFITFEIYCLETQEGFYKRYSYEDFDKEFRFNAELMNPNRKEGRFHWVIERLGLVQVGKKLQLERKPEPTEEVPELPIYETTRKIPTGRMDLKERQRLRESMDMLDIKRSENIQRKRAETKERFLQHVKFIKEQAEKKQREVEKKIAEEKLLRERRREEEDLREEDERLKHLADAKVRNRAVDVKEQRTQEQDEEEYRLLRERWRVLDAEREADEKQAHQKKQAELDARNEAALQAKRHLDELQSKREAIWQMRESRIARKAEAWLKRVLDSNAEKLRQARAQMERNQEFVRLCHNERQPIFREQLERSQCREAEQEQEKEAVAKYVERRALPKKLKTKGANAVRPKEVPIKKAPNVTKAGGKKKNAKVDKQEKEETKSEAELEKEVERARTERVLDAVEAKVRAEMEDERRRAKLQDQRAEKLAEKEKARFDAEVQHMRLYREAHRQREVKAEENAARRRLVAEDREAERAKAAERRQQDLDRLQRVREANIARREEERLAALCA